MISSDKQLPSSLLLLSANVSDDLRKEFEHNYRRYLENAYLFNRINEILLDAEVETSSVPDEMRTVGGDLVAADESARVKKLRQKFLQAINMTSSAANPVLGDGPTSSSSVIASSSMPSSSVSRLVAEEKSFLLGKLEKEINDELGVINQVLNCQFEQHNQKYHWFQFLK